MAVKRFPDLMNHLTSNGRSVDTPIAIIEKGTTPKQRVIRGTLGQLSMLADAHRIAAPAMLIVGEVAALGHAGLPALAESPQITNNHAKPEVRIAR
jgi:siroheme synthase